MESVPSHPVLSCAEARAWEKARLTDEGREWAAMQEAGHRLALAVLEDYRELGGFPEGGRILVLAGKGHNGGDALLAARTILTQHPSATAVVILAFGAGDLRPLAGRALDWLRAQVPDRVGIFDAEEGLAPDDTFALCLDGVFGFQFRAPMAPEAAALINRVNAHRGIRLRVAVDLPSGVSETPAVPVFLADFTYATGCVKHPVLLPRNARIVGRLRYVDIGLLQEDSMPSAPERILLPSLLQPLTVPRPAQTDKRTYGHLLLVGGSHSYPGAVVLAARAALRSGAGLVTAFVPEKFVADYAARHPEVMWVGCPVTPTGGLDLPTAELVRARSAKATALLVGPGMGADSATLALAAQLARDASVPLVLDADALRPEVIAAARAKPFIATPHAGEFERIAPALFTEGKLQAAAAVLVLKGPLTRVTDGQTIYHSPFGGPVLARGGSGDLLAGLIAGLLAQAPEHPGLAACRGVVWHGRAADLLARTRGQVAIEISEILEQLGPALVS